MASSEPKYIFMLMEGRYSDYHEVMGGTQLESIIEYLQNNPDTSPITLLAIKNNTSTIESYSIGNDEINTLTVEGLLNALGITHEDYFGLNCGLK